MMDAVLPALLALCALYYLGFLFKVRKGLERLDTKEHNTPGRTTVIIAARNEEATVGETLRAVLGQEYPSDLLQVILIDDSSTDRTVDVAQSIAQTDRRLTVLRMPHHADDEGARKPAAITEAIKSATGDFILTTDADCIVGPRWVKSMVSLFDSGTAFVAGPVVEQKSPGLLPALSRLEFLGLITTAAGLIGAGSPIICNGANIAYRKSAFLNAGGYGDRNHFSDDEVLMQRILSRKLGKIVFSELPGSIVWTKSPRTLWEFWNQRIRWASKRGHYEEKRVLLKVVGLYLFFLMLLVSFFVSPPYPTYALVTAAVFFLKVGVELNVLLRGSTIFGQPFSAIHFLIAELLHVPYIVVAAFAGQFASLEWKGKPIHR